MARQRLRTASIAVAGVAIAVGLTGTPGAAAGGRAAGSPATAAATAKPATQLLDVAAVPKSHDVWAIGLALRANNKSYLRLDHRHASKWTVIERPADPAYGLTRIAATSPKTAWVGGTRYTAATSYPVVQRLHGTALLPTHMPQISHGQVHDLAASSSHNVWAVGVVSTSKPKPLALRYDGHQWKRRSPFPPSTYGDLLSVATTGPSDVWVLGQSQDASAPLVAHFNGNKWQRYSPEHDNTVALNSIAATSGKNAYVVGYRLVNSHGQQQQEAYANRWNGKVWKVEKTPTSGAVRLLNVAAVGSTAFAVGQRYVSSQPRAYILQRTSTGWHHVVSPQPGKASLLYAVAAHSATDATAVGSSATTACIAPNRALALRWDGRSWQNSSAPLTAKTTRGCQ